MLLITSFTLMIELWIQTTTTAHWIPLKFNVHSMILYSKSKKGKTFLKKIPAFKKPVL